MSSPDYISPLCRKCGRLRTVIPGHEDKQVHPLCDKPDVSWWTPEELASLQQNGNNDG